MKYGDDALTQVAGIQAHIQGIANYVTPNNVQALKTEMLQVFNQKHELGLVQVKNPIRSFSSRKPELILALANHDPGSEILRRELSQVCIPDDFPVDVKVALANFLGYGLFEQNVFSLDEFQTRFAGHI